MAQFARKCPFHLVHTRIRTLTLIHTHFVFFTQHFDLFNIILYMHTHVHLAPNNIYTLFCALGVFSISKLISVCSIARENIALKSKV